MSLACFFVGGAAAVGTSSSFFFLHSHRRRLCYVVAFPSSSPSESSERHVVEDVAEAETEAGAAMGVCSLRGRRRKAAAGLCLLLLLFFSSSCLPLCIRNATAASCVGLGSCPLFPVNGKKAGGWNDSYSRETLCSERNPGFQSTRFIIGEFFIFSLFFSAKRPSLSPLLSPISWEIRNIKPKINDQTGKGKMELGKKKGRRSLRKTMLYGIKEREREQ